MRSELRSGETTRFLRIVIDTDRHVPHPIDTDDLLGAIQTLIVRRYGLAAGVTLLSDSAPVAGHG